MTGSGTVRRCRVLVALVVLPALFVTAVSATATGAAPAKVTKQPQGEPAMSGTTGQRVVNGVTNFGKGFVAVGYEADSAGHSRAAIWTIAKPSATYTRVPDSAFTGDFLVYPGVGDNGRINVSLISAVTSSDNALVGGGDVRQLVPQSDGSLGATPQYPAAYYSQDGQTWQTVVLPVPGDDEGLVVSVTFQSGRWIAAGSVSSGDGNSSAIAHPAVWYSDDGTTWNIASGVTDSVSTNGGIQGVAAAGPRASPKFVAVGGFDVVTDAGTERSGAVWTSDDGATWTRVPTNAAFGEGDGVDESMDAVAAVGDSDGFIAVGEESKTSSLFIAPKTAVIWHSKDGVEWTRSNSGAKQFATGDKSRNSTTLNAVALGDGYYVLTGLVEKTTNKDTQPRFRGWTSVDGKKWDRLVVDDRTDTVDSEGRGVATSGKHYQIVGTVMNNGNDWAGNS